VTTYYCPQCRAGLLADLGNYVTRLIDALQHPEPLTRRRAAHVLGMPPTNKHRSMA